MDSFLLTLGWGSIMINIKNFICGEEAATAVEYAVMLALIIVTCVGGVLLVGQKTEIMWGNVDTELQGHGF